MTGNKGQKKKKAPKYNPDEPLTNAAARTFQQHVKAVLKNEAGTRENTDIEFLHKMRVASNRLRVAVVLFWHCFPRKKITFLRGELRWLARSLGVVRDLDVTIERLEGIKKSAPVNAKAGYDVFISEIKMKRDARFESLTKTLDSKRYIRLKKALMDIAGLEPEPEPEGETGQNEYKSPNEAPENNAEVSDNSAEAAI